MGLKGKKIICWFIAAVCALCSIACGNNKKHDDSLVNETYRFYNGERVKDTRGLDSKEYATSNSVSVDMYGREYGSSDVRKTDKNRYTGMMYFLNVGSGNDVKGVYNVTEILEQYGDEGFASDSQYSPSNASHIWGQPALGYYSSGDEWVIRKHVEMFAAIGIDFLLLDCSNSVTYEPVAKKLFDIIAEYRAAGWKVPQVAYMLNNSGSDIIKIITDKLAEIKPFYDNAKYADVWFKPQPENKPMLVGSVDAKATVEAGVSGFAPDYFYYRPTQWPQDPQKDDAMPWIDFEFPQTLYEDAMNVSVAQHVTYRFSDTEGARGRGWTSENGNNHEEFGKGANFLRQWETVFAHDESLRFVTITGWNEWAAMKTNNPTLATHGNFFMGDTFNDEYSRDIEPCKESKLLDTPYLQTVNLVHDYTREEAKHYEIPVGSHALDDFGVWENAAVYEDFTGEAGARKWPRFDGKVTLQSPASRVDFKSLSVCVDDENMYFRIETVNDIPTLESDDTTWMNLMLKPANAKYTDDYGYSYVINRVADEILAVNGKGEYVSVGKAQTAIKGNVMLVKVPLAALSLTKEHCMLDIKVADSFGYDGMSFYSQGDCMPCGRLSYRFGY